jgi:hypothetical protein
MDKEKNPPKKFGLIKARTVSPIGQTMFAFSGGLIGGAFS